MSGNLSNEAIGKLSSWLACTSNEILRALDRLPRNVKIVICRRFGTSEEAEGPKIIYSSGEESLARSLRDNDNLEKAIFNLARIYDYVWFTIFQNYTRAGQGKSHEPNLLSGVETAVEELVNHLRENPEARNWDVGSRFVPSTSSNPLLILEWRAPLSVDLSILPTISSLASLLPGEERPGKCLAGVGTGGGSDIVTASILGHLFRGIGKEMDLLISTRSVRTGSQGKPGSGKVGSKREIYSHGGHALTEASENVLGTFKVTEQTRSEGRDVERVPLRRHKEIWIALDPGEQGISDAERDQPARLHDQIYSIIWQFDRNAGPNSSPTNTIVAVDTGGDVFGSLESFGKDPTPPGAEVSHDPQKLSNARFTTPDQDTHTILELTSEPRPPLNLVLAIVCPGIDSPPNLAQIAKQLGGVRYVPTAQERKTMIDLLTEEYHMDGRDDSRFGKSSLCLLEALRRRDRIDHAVPESIERSTVGEWASLPLPEHVIHTRDNPWACFAQITDAMAEIILVPMERVGEAIRYQQLLIERKE